MDSKNAIATGKVDMALIVSTPEVSAVRDADRISVGGPRFLKGIYGACFW